MKILECSENLKNNDREIYKLTKSGMLEKVKEHEGEVISIVEYVLFEDTNKDGKEVEILSFITSDGECFATNSATVIKTFKDMKEVLGFPIKDVEIVSGESKHGTKYYNLMLK